MLGQFAHGNNPMPVKAILKTSIRFEIDFEKLDMLLELLNVIKYIMKESVDRKLLVMYKIWGSWKIKTD